MSLSIAVEEVLKVGVCLTCVCLDVMESVEWCLCCGAAACWGGGKHGTNKRRAILQNLWKLEEEEEEPYLRVKCMCVRSLADLFLYPCTPPTAPVSRSFGLRSSYEIAIFDTD
jgi:hypothetical protein